MKNLYVQMKDYDILLDLDKATAIQRFNDRMVIHFTHPDESFVIFEDQTEFNILEEYFKMLAKSKLRFMDFILRENNNESIQ
jgi:hypothetical protein